MRITTSTKSILVCDYCYPEPAVGITKDGKRHLCKECMEIEE
ncbi:MAG: hypothetical protein R2685_10985 [Candidatus Nitrosocosmicus sp.]